MGRIDEAEEKKVMIHMSVKTKSPESDLDPPVIACIQVGHATMIGRNRDKLNKKQEDEYDFVFEDTIEFVSQEVLQQKLRYAKRRGTFGHVCLMVVIPLRLVFFVCA